MIVFDLKCDQSHGFEAWFASSMAFDDQRVGGLISCPYCGSSDVMKAAMAPRIGSRSQDLKRMPAEASKEVERAEIMGKLVALQKQMLTGSTWVGDQFATKARAMAEGTETTGIIHGSATRADAQSLHEDGIGVMPLLIPVVPPEQLN